MALAPMADVTDVAFREMFARHGKPDVCFTEFVSVDGLCSAGKENLKRELLYTERQRPIVAQIWGTDPSRFYRAAKLLKGLGFDGIDINMGCPKRREVSLGACAALIQHPTLARKIIKETQRGAGKVPVSVKTRLGFNKIETVNWLKHLLRTDPAVITLHARTAKEMSKVPAHWEEVEKAVNLRNKLKRQTLIIGNGDIKSLLEAYVKARQTGADGVMVGRAALGNPWFFNPEVSSGEISFKQKLSAAVEHAFLFEKFFKRQKNFSILCKHFKAYVSGFEGARELRNKLMSTKNARQVAVLVEEFLHKRNLST